MPVKIATRLVNRFIRTATKETTSSTAASTATAQAKATAPANEGTRQPSTGNGVFAEAGSVSHRFGQELHQQTSAYTGSVDEFGCPGNTVDSWRLQFSRTTSGLEAANGTSHPKRRQG